VPCTLLSYNTAEYGRPGRVAERAPAVEAVIAEAAPTVALLQEIYAPTPAEADDRVRRLAAATGLCCELEHGRVAVAFGGHEMHSAILWNPDHAQPVAGSFRFYGDGELWHALVIGTVQIEGVRLSVGSYHAPSLGRNKREDEAERIMLAVVSGYTDERMVVCGDFNSLSNARLADGEFYDPDPYAGKSPDPQFVFQTRWSSAADGAVTDLHADRRPADVLSLGGLVDLAPALGEPWQPTIGHWRPDGPHGFRRIDHAWATPAAVSAARSCSPLSGDQARTASDHFPLVVELDLAPAPITGAGV
jgi:endonuclease/exonuclease/phosphatase family metal-dependent hydrolase